MTKAEYFIGTSGWSYRHWKNIFYPDALPPRQWLAFYSESFNSVELNMSFYRTPLPNMIMGWIKKTPPGFVFAVKAPRYITHIKRLKDIEDSIKKLYSLAADFKGKCRCILFQFPSSFRPDGEGAERVEKFLDLLEPGYDHALEFRHPSWWKDDFTRLLKGRAAFCVVDGLDMPGEYVITADFMYMRLHGQRYNTDYSEDKLRKVSEIIKEFSAGHSLKRIYAYFNNDAQGFAVRNALYMTAVISH